MSTVVFLGPSLPLDTARSVLDAVYMPPVTQGDVYRACTGRPDAIAIVDGRFQDVPAVWHKEILWALAQGVPVYGSSSMGALRAAELDSFGMVGVGAVYRAFRDGVLEDDDEVAVAHRGRDEGYAAISEPMVDIRWTLEAASFDGVIDGALAATLIAVAKEMFYPQRSYQAVLDRASRQGLVEPGQRAELAAWIHRHRIQQKRDDAIELLTVLQEQPRPAPVPFTFEHTQFFERARRSAGSEVLQERTDPADGETGGSGVAVASGTNDGASTVTLEALLDELRLDPDRYRETRLRAVLRCVAAREQAREQRATVEDLQAALDRFRRARRLAEPADTQRWMSRNHLGLRQLASLAREDVAVAELSAGLEGELDIYLRNELRSSGQYAALARRAQHKQASLQDVGAADASFDQVDDEQVLTWYFARIQRPRPPDLDAHMRTLGYSDPVVFLRALKREFMYERVVLRSGEPRADHQRAAEPAHT